MKESFTAVIKQSNNWWIGWIEEISGVNCQEATKEELLAIETLTNDLFAEGDMYEEELIAL